jgi:DinB superfamily
MGEIEGLRQRVEVVRREYAALPRDGWGEPGPADERTGERWDRGNVLGHVAEMLPFWTAQIRAVIGGAGEMGRDAVGMAQRRMGIDSGREAGEDGLLTRIDEGMAGLQGLLADVRDADLDRPLRFRSPDAERDRDLRWTLEHMLVGHLEEHLGQLRSLDG